MQSGGSFGPATAPPQAKPHVWPTATTSACALLRVAAAEYAEEAAVDREIASAVALSARAPASAVQVASLSLWRACASLDADWDFDVQGRRLKRARDKVWHIARAVHADVDAVYDTLSGLCGEEPDLSPEAAAE